MQNSTLTRKSAFNLTAACRNLRTTLLLTFSEEKMCFTRAIVPRKPGTDILRQTFHKLSTRDVQMSNFPRHRRHKTGNSYLRVLYSKLPPIAIPLALLSCHASSTDFFCFLVQGEDCPVPTYREVGTYCSPAGAAHTSIKCLALAHEAVY